MEVLYQGSYLCSVKKVQDYELLAETVFLNTALEAVGMLLVDSKNFGIKEARWEIHRAPDPKLLGGGFLPELNGVEAYFSIGGALNRVANGEGGSLIRDLLAECVRGIIQAETYIYEDRGFSSADDYDNYWRREHANSCRYESNLNRVVNDWFTYIGNHRRKYNLFNRYKSMAVYQQTDGSFFSTGSFSDSYHELNIQLSFDGMKGMITSCKGTFLRAPDVVCFENSNNLAPFIGKSITELSKKEVAKITGGPDGCFHLVDIIHDTLVASSVVLKKQAI